MDRTPDDLLVAELREALATLDPVPDHVLASARKCLTWRSVDAELATLTRDSTPGSLATGPAGPIRSAAEPTEPRLLTFEGPGITIEVEVTPLGEDHGKDYGGENGGDHAATRSLVGQLVPPRPAWVDVRWPGGGVTVEADTVGIFTAAPVPSGPVSLACSPPEGSEDGPRVVTSWVTI